MELKDSGVMEGLKSLFEKTCMELLKLQNRPSRDPAVELAIAEAATTELCRRNGAEFALCIDLLASSVFEGGNFPKIMIKGKGDLRDMAIRKYGSYEEAIRIVARGETLVTGYFQGFGRGTEFDYPDEMGDTWLAYFGVEGKTTYVPVGNIEEVIRFSF